MVKLNASIEILVTQKIKNKFFRLCKANGYLPSQVIRLMIHNKLAEFEGGNEAPAGPVGD